MVGIVFSQFLGIRRDLWVQIPAHCCIIVMGAGIDYAVFAVIMGQARPVQSDINKRFQVLVYQALE